METKQELLDARREKAFRAKWGMSRAAGKRRFRTLEKFTFAKFAAKSRGIPWEMTFQEWYQIWAASGKWKQRGPHRNGFVMARYGDKGPYAPSNVRIIPQQENRREFMNRFWTEVRAGKRKNPNANLRPTVRYFRKKQNGRAYI